MGKNTEVKKEVHKSNEAMNTSSFAGKTEDEIREIRENLKVQIQQQKTLLGQEQLQVQTRTETIIKFQGAYELTCLMLPEEKENDTKNTNRNS